MIKRFCNRCEREVDVEVRFKGVKIDYFKSKNARDVLAFAGLSQEYDTCEACSNSLQKLIEDWYYTKIGQR